MRSSRPPPAPDPGRPRILILFCLLLGALGLITTKLFALQVTGHRGLSERAHRQYQRLVPLTSKRGSITDRNGRDLAASLRVSSVFAQPAAVEDPARAARALAGALGLPAREILGKLRSDRPFVWIRRRVEPDVAEAVVRLSLRGVGLLPESRRYYPRQELAAHLLGFVGLDDRGLEGLEFQYDTLLGGQPRWVTAQQDARGRIVFRTEEADGPPGYDLILTIDEVLQYVTERELQAAVEKSEARGGTAIILDPHTGEILALANVPTFNPNRYQEAESFARRDRAVTDAFEPGSVFKVFLAAGALEERVVQPQDRIYGENGAIQLGGLTIRDHEKYGWLTVADVIAQSSNVGAIKIGLRLGKTLYYNYLSGFGFGSATGVDLPGETPGLIRRPRHWSAVSLGALSIGQEVSVSPLQVATAVAAVANGGSLVRPFVGKALRSADGQVVRETAPLVLRRVISTETAHRLTDILERVVLEGTGKAAAVEGYAVAGKTGTAQKLEPATGRYSHGKVLASFVGFVPARAPRLCILVMIDEPKKLMWGGAIAAPTFREIAREALLYLKIPPAQGEQVRLARQVALHAARHVD